MNISRRLAFGSISVATAVVAALLGVYLVSGAVDRSPADATPLQITSSGDDWSGLITMTGTFTAGGNLSGTPSTRFGVCPTCDELFNPGFDTGTSTLDFGELLRAFLFYPLNNPNFFNNNQQQLKVSKIADGADISWPLKLLFRSQDAGKGVNISMTSAEIADIPGAPGRRVVLLDSGGNEIADLRASVFVVPVTIPASTPFELDFTIRVFSPPPLPLGPNLVSPASGDRSNNSTPPLPVAGPQHRRFCPVPAPGNDQRPYHRPLRPE